MPCERGADPCHLHRGDCLLGNVIPGKLLDSQYPFDVLTVNGLICKCAFVLAGNLDIYFCVVEVIVIQVVQPLREFGELFAAAFQF